MSTSLCTLLSFDIPPFAEFRPPYWLVRLKLFLSSIGMHALHSQMKCLARKRRYIILFLRNQKYVCKCKNTNLILQNKHQKIVLEQRYLEMIASLICWVEYHHSLYKFRQGMV